MRSFWKLTRKRQRLWVKSCKLSSFLLAVDSSLATSGIAGCGHLYKICEESNWMAHEVCENISSSILQYSSLCIGGSFCILCLINHVVV